jgi:hypothetical protein
MFRAVCYSIIVLMSISTVLRIACNAKLLSQMISVAEQSLSSQKLTPLQQASSTDQHSVGKYQKLKRRFGDEVGKHMKIAVKISCLPHVFFV